MSRDVGEIIPGVGVIIACADCKGVGWTMHPTLAGTRLMCDRCTGSGTLLDDSATSGDFDCCRPCDKLPTHLDAAEQATPDLPTTEGQS